ncbi:histidine kinase dimerization/phosphoacceptor domain-containing protein [Streptomyces sp. NPDC005538]|uniref:histidine kinase dimerization/phosphoacceptor domain-containing protein n=1 Tax=Streptomyces sp. NPDC005538 TaxID=3157043 RepID=UPI0033AAD403
MRSPDRDRAARPASALLLLGHRREHAAGRGAGSGAPRHRRGARRLTAPARPPPYRRGHRDRRAERPAIAADLHDFVAHHVTGILVQTQVARMMATTRPEDLDPVLAAVERASTEALAAMRRTVGVLRDAGPDAADRRPIGDLTAVADLVDGFASPVQKVTLRRDPTPPDDLPHQVQAAAWRARSRTTAMAAPDSRRPHTAEASASSV